MFDFGYVVRLLGLLWRFRGRKVRGDIFGETIIRGQCWLNDLDTNWHMNNARYLRECDFGRFALFLDLGFSNVILKRRKKDQTLNIVVSAIQSQYRQSIQLGDRFTIRTRINGWDQRAFYIEQSIVLDENDQIAFLLLIRVALTSHSVTPQMLVDDLQIGSISSPPLSLQMNTFKDNYKLTFQKLRSKL